MTNKSLFFFLTNTTFLYQLVTETVGRRQAQVFLPISKATQWSLSNPSAITRPSFPMPRNTWPLNCKRHVKNIHEKLVIRLEWWLWLHSYLPTQVIYITRLGVFFIATGWWFFFSRPYAPSWRQGTGEGEGWWLARKSIRSIFTFPHMVPQASQAHV